MVKDKVAAKWSGTYRESSLLNVVERIKRERGSYRECKCRNESAKCADSSHCLSMLALGKGASDDQHESSRTKSGLMLEVTRQI